MSGYFPKLGRYGECCDEGLFESVALSMDHHIMRYLDPVDHD